MNWKKIIIILIIIIIIVIGGWIIIIGPGGPRPGPGDPEPYRTLVGIGFILLGVKGLIENLGNTANITERSQ